MAEKYYIIVNREKVSVSEEVYIAHRQMRRRERTLREKEQRNFVVKYEDFSIGELSGEEQIYDPAQVCVEDIALSNLIYRQLHRAINMLPQSEREIIMALYLQGFSERQLSKESGIPYMTMHYRKAKILAKLKTLMEN